MIDWNFIFMIVWFTLAAYSVVANDSIQTLWTFLSSQKWRIKRYWLAAAASIVVIIVICASWFLYNWDISWWRLSTKGIPFPETFTIWHAIAPLWLLVITRFWIPVSTSLLILSVFATNTAITQMIGKSVMWYVIAFIVAYLLWTIISRFIDEFERPKHSERADKLWRTLQRFSTWYLWSVWLMHDMANIAVYLPRSMSWEYLVFTLFLIVSWLFYIFRRWWWKIQDIVVSKIGTRYIRSATIIDFIYASILIFFKERSSIPMSTTRVFVWLLAWRELAIAYMHKSTKHTKLVFPLIAKDFFKIILWLVVSIVLAYAVTYLS